MDINEILHEALVISGPRSARRAEELGLAHERIDITAGWTQSEDDSICAVKIDPQAA